MLFCGVCLGPAFPSFASPGSQHDPVRHHQAFVREVELKRVRAAAERGGTFEALQERWRMDEADERFRPKMGVR